MFAPMILPFQLTCVVFLIVSLLVVFYPQGKGSRYRRVAWFVLLSPILFAGLCAGVGFVVDSIRYGTFEYANISAFHDPYVRLPPSATKITIVRYYSGHHARFTVDPDSFRKWLDDEWVRVSEFMTPVNQKPDYDAARPVTESEFALAFSQLNWSYLPDLHEFDGPTSGRGGGFTAYYSPTRQIGYLRHSYW